MRYTVPMWRAARLLVGLGCFSMSLSSCFLWFDSRTGERERRQREAAAKMAATELPKKAEGRRLRRTNVKELKLRAVASKRYAAQVFDWQDRFRRTVEQANAVLELSVGVRFRVVSMGYFETQDDDLVAALRGLARQEPGAADRWVVGLVASRSLLGSSYRALGVARLGGRHLVVRTGNDALEYDGIRRVFDELSEEEQRKLYQTRRTHREAAVLVHELGHALGAPHSPVQTDLMYPVYNVRQNRLGPPAVAAITRSLTRPGQSAVAGARPGAAPGAWQPTAANAVAPAASDASLLGSSSSAAPQAGSPPATRSPTNGGLDEQERAMLQIAVGHRQRGDIAAAMTAAAPLFETHPENPGVAELRCQLAMDRGLPWDQLQEECAAFREQTAPMRPLR